MFHFLLALIYICFISLGLPDSLLGSAWPILQNDLAVPLSYAGIISALISVGTIISSFFSDKVVRKLGTGRVTAISISMTAVGLFGFSSSTRFWMLVLWSIPYGLGAGAVDSALNNYVALHYKSQHMSWLHCFWGVGASVSPYIMSFALLKLDSWSRGYLIVSVIQILLSAFVFLSLPIWKKGIEGETKTDELLPPPKLREIFTIRGAIPCFLTFFLYCALELTAALWASTYLTQTKAIAPETASSYASLFYIGITLGRGINGFLAMRFKDKTLVRVGLAIIAVGLLLMFLPLHSAFALVGFIIIGFGCAPVYPCIIHMTPAIFGRERSQAMIGMQMAFAYMGFLIMPPIFGIIAQHVSVSLLPLYLSALLMAIICMHETILKKTNN